jgi:hypothetical protein
MIHITERDFVNPKSRYVYRRRTVWLFWVFPVYVHDIIIA